MLFIIKINAQINLERYIYKKFCPLMQRMCEKKKQ